MSENPTIMIVLEELRDFRAENNKRWEQNEKRWETNDKKMEALDERVSRLEEGRKTDKREIVDILDSMQKSVDKQLTEIKDYIAIQFDKINASNTVNEAEHKQFREAIKNLAKRVEFQNSRITALEEWKENFEDGIIGVF